MNKQELIKKVDELNLLRRMGFPMLMPLVKGFDGDWGQAEQTVRQLVGLHVRDKYERILAEMDHYISKQELYDAFVELIRKDFFEKGYKREQLVKEKLANKGWELTETNAEEENQGIDLKGVIPNGHTVCISVKGEAFKYTDSWLPHVEKLSKIIGYDVVLIAYANGKKVEVKEVKNDNLHLCR